MNFQKKFAVSCSAQKCLKGTKSNFLDNYKNILSKIKIEHTKNKEDVKISEAFEIYMLKNFFKINLSKDCEKVLGFWDTEFKSAFDNYIQFFKDNLENQKNLTPKSQKFLKI